MILEALIRVFVRFLLGLLDTISFLNLPFDMVTALSEFCLYGGYVVGYDFLTLFAATVFGWTAAKFLVGIGIRLWELLPFT